MHKATDSVRLAAAIYSQFPNNSAILLDMILHPKQESNVFFVTECPEMRWFPSSHNFGFLLNYFHLKNGFTDYICIVRDTVW